MVEINEIDARVLQAISGKQKLLVLFEAAGYPTIKDIAKALGQWPQDVSACFRGERELPEVREAIAGLLGVGRGDVDHMIGEAASASAA